MVICSENRETGTMEKLDSIDRKILHIIQDNARMTNTELAARIGMSPPPVLERVKKLEKRGYIKKYAALLDPDKVGCGTIVFVSVALAIHQYKSVSSFVKKIQALPEVLECYHLTGEEDYLLKVFVKDIKEYESFVLNKLTKIPGLNKIKTSFVLSTVKYETNLPV
jgi:Lrp/AsnC family leucine-responsive transcriptional regulator